MERRLGIGTRSGSSAARGLRGTAGFAAGKPSPLPPGGKLEFTWFAPLVTTAVLADETPTHAAR